MRRFLLILFCFAWVSFYGGLAFAQGLDTPLIAESRYFSLYCDRSVDLYALVKKINFEYRIYGQNLSEKEDDLRSMLTKSLDGLYMAASDVLDIHIYSYHGNIIIFPDRASLQSFLKRNYGFNLSERSYYFNKENTIYISFADLTPGVIGHEMSHAIISKYFIVPPPAKVQEILAGYVEYSLRKMPSTAP